MTVFNIFHNIIKTIARSLQTAKDYSDGNLQTAKNYTDNVLKTKTTLLADTTITGIGTHALSDSILNYRLIVIGVAAHNNNAVQWKRWIKIPSDVEDYDCSWSATDSLSWYGIISVSLSNSTLTILRFEKSGFSDFSIEITGLN